MLGEGAAFFFLESLESARQRDVPVYAEIVGQSSVFDPDTLHRYDETAKGAVEALTQALAVDGIDPAEVDYISTGANATRGIDAMEIAALQTVFGTRASRVPAGAVKALVGEAFSASGALQVALAIGAIVRQTLPPTVDWTREPSSDELTLVSEQARPARVETVLVESFGLAGLASALVMKGTRNGTDASAFRRSSN